MEVGYVVLSKSSLFHRNRILEIQHIVQLKTLKINERKKFNHAVCLCGSCSELL